MKVGIYYADYSPDTGGGYTFEKDVLSAFVKLAPETHHKFTIFLINPSSETLTSMKLLSSVNISVEGVQLDKKLDFSERIRRLYLKISSRKNALQGAVETHGIQLMWFPTPRYTYVSIPYMATVWDLQHRVQPCFPEVHAGGEWSARELHYSQMLRRASYVIAGTQTGRKEISFFYQVPEEHIRILPHPSPSFACMPDEETVNSVLKQYGLDHGYLFYPAQLWPHKNHMNLLLALKTLKEKYDRILTLVCSGSEKGNQSYLEETVRTLGLDQQVRFLGFVPTRDLVALYCGAFALTYVTFFGPENLPPLEAFSLGCPVIASAVSGAQEQLGDAAILVDPADPDQIADAIYSLGNDPVKRSEMIARGQRRALNWTSNDFVRGVFSIFDEFETIRRAWR